MPSEPAGPASDPSPGCEVRLLQRTREVGQLLRAEVGKIVVGQDEVIQSLLAAVMAQGHVLIVGVPGLAKTLLVRTLSAALGWSFKRIQFTPDMMPSDVIGMELLENASAAAAEAGEPARSWRFVPGPIFAQLVLADEINRTPPKTQSALLEAMQEYTVTSMGHSYPLERPFLVVATQNPIEQEGTYPLPEAQLDRFMFSLWMDYPSRSEEERMVGQTTTGRPPQVSPALSRQEMLTLQALVRDMPATAHVVRYAVALARATRPADPDAPDMVRQYVEWGAGPRASQHLILAAKAMAALDGRPSPAVEDVRRVASGVLRHRVLLNYAAGGEGITPVRVLGAAMEHVHEQEA